MPLPPCPAGPVIPSTLTSTPASTPGLYTFAASQKKRYQPQNCRSGRRIMGQLRSHFHLTLFFPGNVLLCHPPFQTAFPNSGFLMKSLLNETYKCTTPKTFQDLHAKQTINKTVLLNNTKKPILVSVLPLLWCRGGFGRIRASLAVTETRDTSGIQWKGVLIILQYTGQSHAMKTGLSKTPAVSPTPSPTLLMQHWPTDIH